MLFWAFCSRLTYNNAKEMLEKFIKIAPQNAKIDINDFCKYLELPPSEPVQQVFKLYDRVSHHLSFIYPSLT
jgi:hypothetical protein